MEADNAVPEQVNEVEWGKDGEKGCFMAVTSVGVLLIFGILAVEFAPALIGWLFRG